MEIQSFDELIENRKDLLAIHKKNNFTSGIKALLTDLYPDTAHFIYELLQNAEDMFASSVTFKLFEDRLEFEHNGTKRDFNLKDIDAITNIGHNSQKKSDPTSIGKFGVGFKAVFAYTSTPEIHSGKYHFKIQDYFLPDKNVEEISTNKWTKFIFPFNNPKKIPSIALKEIIESLKNIDDNSLLFLKYIKNITYILANGEKGYVHGIEETKDIFKIRYKHHNSEIEKSSEWLRFIKGINIIDEQGNEKKLNIGVAYSLKKIKMNSYKIVPIHGKTYIYFPAAKEHSNLKFHINAPFASTVARDSIRDSKENYKLMENIGKLVSDSLKEIKEYKLMELSFFYVLPNKSDELSEFYEVIFKHIYKSFKTNQYIPRVDFGYVSSKSAIFGNKNMREVFDDKFLEEIFKEKKFWVNSPNLKNHRGYRFLKDMDVFEFDRNYIYDSIMENNFQIFLNKIKGFSIKKCSYFYSLLYEIYDSLPLYIYKRKDLLSKLKNMQIIYTKKSLVAAEDALILPKKMELISEDNYIIPEEIYINKELSPKILNNVKSLFEILEIKDYGPEIEIVKNLKKIEQEKYIINKEYFEIILKIAKYALENKKNEINWGNYKFLLVEENNDLKKEYTKNIILETKEIKKDLNIFAKILDKNIIWKGYQEKYSKKDYSYFCEFLEYLDLEFEFEIERISAKNNPLYWGKLHSDSKETNLGRDRDYTIVGLEKLLISNSIEISVFLWECFMAEESDSYIFFASYSSNGSSEIKTCDSNLLYLLKNEKWLYGNDKQWYSPGEITKENLDRRFRYDKNNSMLNKLKFGFDKQQLFEKEQSKKEEVENFKDKYGKEYILIETKDLSSEELKAVKKEIEKVRKAKEKAAKETSVEEAIDQENKSQQSDSNQGAEFLTSGIVGNKEKRENNIEKTFNKKTIENKPIKKRMQTISISTNEEKEMLLMEYGGRCQICGTEIISYNNKKIFIATNIINSSKLPKKLAKTLEIGWNSVCLCPNCSAKYKYCSKDISTFLDQVRSKEIIEYDDSKIKIKISLNNAIQYIRYTPRHFLALKKVLEITMNEN